MRVLLVCIEQDLPERVKPFLDLVEGNGELVRVSSMPDLKRKLQEVKEDETRRHVLVCVPGDVEQTILLFNEEIAHVVYVTVPTWKGPVGELVRDAPGVAKALGIPFGLDSILVTYHEGYDRVVKYGKLPEDTEVLYKVLHKLLRGE